jgi:V/A-type H+-transporting ATPase subunit I
MIEKMKIVQIVTCAAQKDALVDQLRTLGIVHFAEKAGADREWTERFAALSRMSMALQDCAPKQQQEEKDILPDDRFETLFENVGASMERKKELGAARSAAVTGADRIREWGAFRPADVQTLRDEGIDLHFYRMDKKTYAALCADEDVRFIALSPVDKMHTVAVLGTLPNTYAATEFPLPAKSLTELEEEVAACDQGLAECDEVLRDASKYLPSFRDQMLKAQNNAEYSSVRNTSATEGELVWLSGYIPAAEVERFKTAAAQNHWAWAMDDPAEDDEKIPTKVKYNKVTRLMVPIFDILGTVPGYREYDISFWFLGFFTLFFAMIIGDAGYGCLFLLGAVALTVKDRKLSNTTMLLWVLSIATIIWGALTGTWFGLEGAMKIPFLKSLVIPTFANYPAYFDVSTTTQQNAIMKFCFILGTVQLSLACVMNIRKKLKGKDLSWLSDLGWLAAICALYFVVLYLVIGEKINLTPVAAVVIAGFLMVVLFGGMSPDKSFGQGLKAGVGNAFTVFLNTISAFGNIMSYIRLFAVGMASLAIAQSFNNMASGFSGPLVVAAVLIMVIGHSLNIVMGLLSVVVHGVRLNLLEFSGQLGMEWAGIAYNPFKKLDKIKK